VDFKDPQATHVVTNKSWESEFDDALEENPGLHIVKPSWIFQTHEAQKLAPFQKHLVT